MTHCPKHLKKHLLPGETVQFRARFHWIANIRSGLTENIFHDVIVTDARLIDSHGIMNTHVQSIPHGQIECVDLERSLTGRMFGFGSLMVQGSGSALLQFDNVANPVALMRAIDTARASQDLPNSTKHAASQTAVV